MKTLIGFIQKFPPASYPGRIYGMYKWNQKTYSWERDEKFCKKCGL